MRLSGLLASMLGDGAVPTAHRCECGEPVTVRGDLCAPCREAESVRLRAQILAPARATLPAKALTFAEARQIQGIDRRLLDAADVWRHGSGNLVLLGPKGTGKTVAAAAWMRRALDVATSRPLPRDALMRAVGVRWHNADNLAHCRRRWPLGGGVSTMEQDAIDATVLILDEVGFEARDSRGDNVVDDVIRDRALPRQDVPTIVTSGLTLAELTTRYGDGVRRRLTEHATVVEVHR